MMLAVAAIAAASEEETLRWRHGHGRSHHHHHLPTPFVPTAVVPTTPVPTSPAPTPPEPCSCCDLCNIVPGPFLAVPGGGSSSAPILPPPPAVVNCITALAGLAPCSTFLTGPSARAAGPVAGCLCPILHGDVNVALPKPIDPIRMMLLPSETVSIGFADVLH